MTGTTASDPSDYVAHAVAELITPLRRKSLNGLALMLGAIALVGAITLLILNSGMESEDRWKTSVFPAVIGFVAVGAIYRWTVSTREEMVMPILARSIGFRYGKNARSFVNGLPKRLLPSPAERSGEDHLVGQLGAHTIQMAEVKAETGGKNSKTLFQGIVAQFPNRTAMPAFFIARADKTRPGIFFGGDLSTEGLHHLRDMQTGTRTYGVWTSWNKGGDSAALDAVIDVLCGLDATIGSGAELYAATSNGEEMHVALSHRRNLFKIGGLLPSEARILSDVQRAMQDLVVPVNLAKALIAAEEAAVARV